MKNKKLIKAALSMAIMSCTLGCSAGQSSNDASLGLRLQESEYASPLGESGGQGLSDASNVGVLKDKFNNERLYGSELLTPDVIIYAKDYGVSGEDGKDDTNGLIKALDACKNENGKLVKLVLPSGDLDFIEQMNPLDSERAIVIRDQKNLIISGKGTNIYFHGETAGFLVEDCENIYFEDFTVDWGVPPASTGTILESDGQTFLVQLHDGYSAKDVTKVAAFLEFSKTAYTPLSRGNDIYGNVRTFEDVGNNQLKIVFNYKYAVPPKGTLVSIRHYLYEYDCFFMNRCKNIHIESVTLYSTPGMGARIYTSENLYFNRFSAVRKPNTDRLMSINADMIHLIDCYGDCSITNSLFENCGDDGFNGHGAYLVISSVSGTNSIIAINPRGYNFEPRVGDKMEIASNLDLSLMQTLTVQSVSKETSGGFEITFNEAIDESIKNGFVVSNITKTPKVVISNNIFRNKRCRGVLIQSRNVLVSNNTFANLSDAGILMTADSSDWFESIVPGDVTIKNNKFLKNNFGSGSTGGDIAITAFGQGYNLATMGAIKNVTIENNFFGSGANSAIYANSVSDLLIKNNLAYNMALLPKNSIYDAGFYIAYSRDVTLVSNAVYLNSSSSFKTISIGPSVNTETFEVANNYGFDESDIKSDSGQTIFNLPSFDGSGLAISGTDLSAWETMPDSMTIKGISDVDLKEREPDDSSFKLNSLKVAYDDKALYLAYDVYDDHVSFSTTSSFWEGDGVEIFVGKDTTSLDPLSVLKLTDENCLELFMSGDKTYGNKIVELRTSDAIIAKKSLIEMSFAIKDVEDGYVGKAKIPFEAIPGIKESIDSGEAFSFCLAFMDHDPDEVRVQYGTCENLVEYNKYVPLHMSKLKVGANNE